jgi:hypothetical protein
LQNRKAKAGTLIMRYYGETMANQVARNQELASKNQIVPMRKAKMVIPNE